MRQTYKTAIATVTALAVAVPGALYVASLKSPAALPTKKAFKGFEQCLAFESVGVVDPTPAELASLKFSASRNGPLDVDVYDNGTRKQIGKIVPDEQHPGLFTAMSVSGPVDIRVDRAANGAGNCFSQFKPAERKLG